jgi:glycosyltransferase involved in cell wall biosynthesis
LLASSFPGRVNMRFIDTSSRRRPLSKTGSWGVLNLVFAVVDCVRFAWVVLFFRPEICHIATAFGLSFVKHSVCVVIARLLGSKVLIHPHCSYTILYEQRSRGWQSFVRKVIGLCSGVVALSNEWNKLQGIVPGCRIYYLPNAINTQDFIEIGLGKLQAKAVEDCLHILYLGYLGRAKGTFDLILAAKAVLEHEQGVVFDLVGQELTAGELGQLNNQVVDGGLEEFIHIHQPVNGPEKIEAFRTADIFVYPSYHEGMPMAVIEAMACGLPIIASRVGGLPDLVLHGQNGLLVPAGQPDQLAAAIRRLVVDADMRYSMQVVSFQLAQENYDMERLVLKLVDIYNTVLMS